MSDPENESTATSLLAPDEIGTTGTGLWRRDDHYYIPDGNVIILVENTLFKVHRSILANDTSIFEEMFNPSEHRDASEEPEDGLSDELPIRFPEDTVSQFRALLWSLYALPADLLQATNGDSCPEQRLLDLAIITNKYQFRTTEKWCIDVLIQHYKTPNVQIDPHMLPSLSQVAKFCQSKPLLTFVEGWWKRLSIQGGFYDIMIETAVRHDFKRVLGYAYHGLMLKGRTEWDKYPSLDREHRIRVLAGFYNLTKECANLHASPPTFVHHTTCGPFRLLCEAQWIALWKEITRSNGLYDSVSGEKGPDYLGRHLLVTGTINAILENRSVMSSMVNLDNCSDECLKLALAASRKRQRDTQNNLLQYFLDI
ncbi:hypothetical protein HGRIS_006309 [Hohenbuehelia grisea]|uniref:BTB domain-containing protein n=1 Tax=Hohenbuehelia grisea TaxID=104357 RepID=A0ABR3JZH2_9AGAR